jgi:glyoxylase-like metal-dependent hydrolase (beta-lactamase superfamily II)
MSLARCFSDLDGGRMSSNSRMIADDVMFVRTMMVNVYLIKHGASWVLVDAGLRGYADAIRQAARDLVGSDAPPSAILLTHAHFDHIGSLEALLERWDVPVFAHPLERPYLTGRSSYPPPDPLVGRGAMALLSRLYPRGPIDISGRLQRLGDGRSVPVLEGWQWVPTPGHTAGHVSFYRERDRLLIAGDAVTTTKQESVMAVATQRPELHGPPAYFTQDWRASADSVGRIAALEPETLASGHGEPQSGAAMRRQLRELAARFMEREVPRFGRYAQRPAVTDEQGIVSLPPDPLPKVAAGLLLAAGVAWGLAQTRGRGMAARS